MTSICRHIVLFLIACYICISPALAQSPAIQWQKSLGGSGADQANAIRQTGDGGYIVAGQTGSTDGDVAFSHGSNDFWVVKLKNDGTIEWQKSLGGSGDDAAQSIQPTADQGYIVAGYSNSTDGDVTGNHGGYDYWVVKLDNTGGIQWQKSLGGSASELAYAIQPVADGYIIVGKAAFNNGDVTGNHGNSDYWVVKLKNDGSIEWQKSLGGWGEDVPNSVQSTTDGGYIVAGYTGSIDGDVTANHGSFDYWIVKLSGSGSIQWQKSLGGSDIDFAQDIQSTPDQGCVVAGYSSSTDGDVTGNHGTYDYWIVKLSNDGTIEWQKCFGGSTDDIAESIQLTTDGGCIVAGKALSNNSGDVTGNHGNGDYWLVKLNGSGVLQWQKCLGSSEREFTRSVQLTTDGGYIVGGTSFNTNNGDVTGNHGSHDYWVVKLMPDAVLPVSFTSLSAGVVGNELQVNWKVETEENCAYYEVQASTDGKTFTRIGTMNSLVPEGNSTQPIAYHFACAAGGFALSALGLWPLLLAFSEKRRFLKVVLLATAVFVLGFMSCTRENGFPKDSVSPVFVRIAQVAKGGNVVYSKTVRAVNE